jgi:hypothetical protein
MHHKVLEVFLMYESEIECQELPQDLRHSQPEYIRTHLLAVVEVVPEPVELFLTAHDVHEVLDLVGVDLLLGGGIHTLDMCPTDELLLCLHLVVEAFLLLHSDILFLLQNFLFHFTLIRNFIYFYGYVAPVYVLLLELNAYL